jgi:hypothetical protein
MIAIIDKPAKDGDHDEKGKAAEALDYHEKHLQGHDELYIAAAEQMTPAKRNAWKGLIALARKAEKDQRF